MIARVRDGAAVDGGEAGSSDRACTLASTPVRAGGRSRSSAIPGKATMTQRLAGHAGGNARNVTAPADAGEAAETRSDEGHEDPFGFHLLGAGGDGATVPAIAARGVSGAGQKLPHGERIQASFGRHDVSGVRAHVGGDAAEAAGRIGAAARC